MLPSQQNPRKRHAHSILAAGFIGFFVMLAYIAGGLIWFTCGVMCFCFLLVALFSMVMWVFTLDTHAFDLMLGYLCTRPPPVSGLLRSRSIGPG